MADARRRRRGRGARSDGYARGARILSVGIASTGLFTFAYFAVASHVPRRRRLRRDRAAVGGPVRRHLGHLPAGRAAAVAHDRRAPRARPDRRPPAARAAARSRPRSRSRFLVVALALRGPIEDASSTARRRCTGSSSRATLAYAASYFARGYLAGHQWFGLYGGLVLFESVSRFCFPLAVAVGHRQRPVRGRARHRSPRRWPRCSSCRGRWRATRRRRERDGPSAARELTLRAGAGFALAVAAIQLAEQTLLNAAVLIVGASASTALAGVVFNALLDHARAAAALPGGADLAAAPPQRARGDRGPRRLRARDPRHRARDRRLRRRRRARAAARSGRAVMDARCSAPATTTAASAWR